MTAAAAEVVAPAFQVVGGDPTDAELAALAVVISSLRRERGQLAAPENPRISGGWKSYWHIVRGPLFPGSNSWRATLRR
ncbi:acyl-CoA carboxylase subunit epsilon [Propioniciclava tarda]|uniref:Acyl-CoA carboxylase subunit epsilon n=1 Tax=Propioniciclava tarda TaxID=433330 RepID=A0A4Q9KLF9_PROTD|nr:acyl-CoA carboxylase subunit epsilon [Propioniciclava tarda]TBT95318.1 acyl-CoA carboxylase subunit epsilon [Propioniciclava tarda]SMO60816.1 Acyl-CoA carboxylase epsilon subunit [Propioniciclava tarda]HOA88352.1 acyl-CoA carboxylase subunit epsilon [Propioniciclava tarda]HQA30597.1 acyl-CoA carboxylase subunit epsilon [Propioniciclava tarda]HQD60318.1 acyl-CoA carboxylase subunit epsilon [Propioniciclava tarda]